MLTWADARGINNFVLARDLNKCMFKNVCPVFCTFIYSVYAIIIEQFLRECRLEQLQHGISG